MNTVFVHAMLKFTEHRLTNKQADGQIDVPNTLDRPLDPGHILDY